MLSFINDKIYATSVAYIVERPDQLPRELASHLPEKNNRSFLWVAGRYVQAGQTNKNGHYWTLDDIAAGEASIRHTPLNVLHRWQEPVGTFVETKIVNRLASASDDEVVLPEIQALSVVWAANFPKVAEAVRQAHANKQLWYSMECVAEQKQCLTCNEVFPFRASAHEVCGHLAASSSAPRRFINPTFLGGALIFPPDRPAWPDADITEIAKNLTEQYANRKTPQPTMSVDTWTRLMQEAMNGART